MTGLKQLGTSACLTVCISAICSASEVVGGETDGNWFREPTEFVIGESEDNDNAETGNEGENSENVTVNELVSEEGDDNWSLGSAGPDWLNVPDEGPIDGADNSWMLDSNGEMVDESELQARYEANLANSSNASIEDSYEGLDIGDNDPNAIQTDLGGDGRDHNGGAACGVWLCLPMGFMTAACNAPRRAMISRLLRGKPPAERWSVCTGTNDSDSNNSGFTVYKTKVAFVPPDKLIKNARGCENIAELPERRFPVGCVGTVRFSQVMQHGEPFGTGYYNIAGGVIVDEREHCDIAERDRHPSCFSTVPSHVTSEELRSKSPEMLFENLCPLTDLDTVIQSRQWCWDHSQEHCDLVENTSTNYCRVYFDILEAREDTQR